MEKQSNFDTNEIYKKEDFVQTNRLILQLTTMSIVGLADLVCI
jgi:hypothetical protein